MSLILCLKDVLYPPPNSPFGVIAFVRQQSTEISRTTVDFLHEMVLDLQLHPHVRKDGADFTPCLLHEDIKCTRELRPAS